jgi:sugar phosphate isomerase/epimerase
MMIFGYSTNAFKKFTLIDSIEKIARLGFRGVEIMGDRPHLYPPDFAEKQLEHLNEVLAINNLTVTNLNSFTFLRWGIPICHPGSSRRKKDGRSVSVIPWTHCRSPKNSGAVTFRFRRADRWSAVPGSRP